MHHPDKITELAEGEVFVFEANSGGAHTEGTALLAEEKFGALDGHGVGHYGRSYAIPTVDLNDKPMTAEAISRHIDNFLAFARSRPDLTFKVTPIGCGLAGYSAKEMAPLFWKGDIPANVNLPAEFVRGTQ